MLDFSVGWSARFLLIVILGSRISVLQMNGAVCHGKKAIVAEWP